MEQVNDLVRRVCRENFSLIVPMSKVMMIQVARQIEGTCGWWRVSTFDIAGEALEIILASERREARFNWSIRMGNSFRLTVRPSILQSQRQADRSRQSNQADGD